MKNPIFDSTIIYLTCYDISKILINAFAGFNRDLTKANKDYQCSFFLDKNGILNTIKDSRKLIKLTKIFINFSKSCQVMGKELSNLKISDFDIQGLFKKYLEIYSELIER
tara:strand:+ start:496 stop:825 length:330 start_codon:yes stop_codon:yes gene_type:complete